MVFQFCSTSKVTFPGAGIAAVSASKANLDDIRKHLTLQTIGHDKINQMRHAKFFPDADSVRKHMAAQAEIIRPKEIPEKRDCITRNRQMGNPEGRLLPFL